MRSLIDRLTAARIGRTTNFYRHGPGAALRRERLAAYLEARAGAPILLVGEAPGYRAGLPFARELAEGRRIVAVGRIAASALGAAYVRHPSHGGADAFREGLLPFAPGGRLVRPFSV